MGNTQAGIYLFPKLLAFPKLIPGGKTKWRNMFFSKTTLIEEDRAKSNANKNSGLK